MGTLFEWGMVPLGNKRGNGFCSYKSRSKEKSYLREYQEYIFTLRCLKYFFQNTVTSNFHPLTSKCLWKIQKQLIIASKGCVCLVAYKVAHVMSNSLRPSGLQSARLLCPWGFSRQEYWRGLPCHPPGDLSNPGTEPRSLALQADSLPSEPPGKPTSKG